MVILNTKRLTIREFEEEDWQDIYEFLMDEEVCRYMVFEPLNEEKSKEYLKKFIEIKKKAPRNCYKFVVVLNKTNKVIGECGIVSPDIKDKVGETVYRFNKDYWGFGYATEAANEVVKFGFGKLGLHRIEGYCDERNKASANILAKLGFTYEGCLREHKFIKGYWRSSLVYSKLRQE